MTSMQTLDEAASAADDVTRRAFTRTSVDGILGTLASKRFSVSLKEYKLRLHSSC